MKSHYFDYRQFFICLDELCSWVLHCPLEWNMPELLVSEMKYSDPCAEGMCLHWGCSAPAGVSAGTVPRAATPSSNVPPPLLPGASLMPWTPLWWTHAGQILKSETFMEIKKKMKQTTNSFLCRFFFSAFKYKRFGLVCRKNWEADD